MTRIFFRFLAVAAIGIGVTGCLGRIGEEKHFASIDPETKEIVNIFRVEISGTAMLSNARYLSGYYDERAVDYFFNEVKSNAYNPATVSTAGPDRILATECPATSTPEACRQRRLELIPVGEDAGKKGAYVLILSTNTDAIVDTIGSLSENQVVMNSALSLATRGDTEEARRLQATAQLRQATRGAVVAELDALFAAVEPQGLTEDAAKATHRKNAYLQILQAIAAALRPGSSPTFKSFEAARGWFAAFRTAGGS